MSRIQARGLDPLGDSISLILSINISNVQLRGSGTSLGTPSSHPLRNNSFLPHQTSKILFQRLRKTVERWLSPGKIKGTHLT